MAATRRNSSGSVRESGQGIQWSSWQPGHLASGQWTYGTGGLLGLMEGAMRQGAYGKWGAVIRARWQCAQEVPAEGLQAGVPAPARDVRFGVAAALQYVL